MSCSTAHLWDHAGGIHLEGQPGLDLLLQGLGNNAIELGQDLHGELRVDALLSDQLVERIRQGNAEAVGTGVSAMACSPRRARAGSQQTGLSEPAKIPSMAVQIVVVV